MTAVSNHARALALALVAAVALALIPALPAAAVGPGSMTLTVTSDMPAGPSIFVALQGPEGTQLASFNAFTKTATASDLALGEYTASVSSGPYSPGGSVTFSLTEASPSFVGELVLPPWPTGTSTLSGRILDDDGAPVSGANVALFSGERSFPSATTGPDGTYRFTAIPAGDYSISAYRDGYFSRSAEATVADGQSATQDLTLPVRNASISGRIVDSAGTPIANATVQAQAPNMTDGAGTMTNPDGTYVLSGLGRGGWIVSAGGPGTPYGKVDVSVTLTSGQNATIADIALTPRTTGSVFGFVQDTATPYPQSIADICVKLLRTTGTPVGATSVTVVDGTFAFFDVAPGTYTAVFSDCSTTRQPQFATTYYGGAKKLTGATRFSVEAAQETYLEQVLMPVQPPAQPSQSAVAVKLRDLRPSTYGDIRSSTKTTQGQSLRIFVGTSYADRWVSVWLRSPTTQLGGWLRVASDGYVTVTTPAAYPAGAHLLVVQDDRNKVIGWKPVLVRKAR